MYEYKKIAPEDVYLGIIDRETTEEELWQGVPAVFTGNRPCGNPFIDLYATLVRKYQFLDSKDYAAKLGLPASDFIATIRSLTGLAPNDWRDRYIMLSAHDLLCHTKMNMTAVSKRLGFVKSTIFSRYFKKHTGFTPSDYRWRNRK